MSLADLLSLVATAAAVIAAVYAVLAYHRPKAPPGAERSPRSTTRRETKDRRSLVPIVAAIVAWAAIAFNFVDRHWFSGPVQQELPLTAENARLEFRLEPVWKDAEKQFFMNFHIANHGKAMAFETGHGGLTATSPGLIDPDLIDAYFILLHAKMKQLKFPRDENCVWTRRSVFFDPR